MRAAPDTLTEDCDVVRIAAERGDVVTNPLQSHDQIGDARIRGS